MSIINLFSGKFYNIGREDMKFIINGYNNVIDLEVYVVEGICYINYFLW